MKYIDADKLKAEIERLEVLYDEALKNPSFASYESSLIAKGKHRQREDLLSFIDSLHQEQLEVDLEEFTEKMDAWKARFNHPDDIPIKATMAFTARMFYQYPDVARQWYEQLPKTTIDFNARKEESK